MKYHSWGASGTLNDFAEATMGTGSEYKFSAMQYDVYGIVNLPLSTLPMVTPYVKLGGGYYAPSTKLSTPSGDNSTSTSDFGIVGGFGFEVNTHSSMKLGLGANYHRVKNSETDFMSFSARILFPI